MPNDHWTPQFLLKSFVKDGQLWVYDKVTCRRFRTPTKKICCEPLFTKFSPDQVPPGSDPYFLDTELGRWEREQSLVIEKLVNERNIEAILPEEFSELVRFTVWLYLCNPVHRAVLRQSRVELQRLTIKSLTEEELDDLSMKFFGLLLPHAYVKEQLEIAISKDELLQSEFLGSALKSAESIFDLVKKEYAWSLADCKDLGLELCTSDRPVVLGGKALSDPVGFNTPEVILFFPLSPNLCLTGRNIGEDKRFIQGRQIITNPDFLGMPTMLMWGKSNQYIIAKEKDSLPVPDMEIPSYIPTLFKQGNDVGILHR